MKVRVPTAFATDDSPSHLVAKVDQDDSLLNGFPIMVHRHLARWLIDTKLKCQAYYGPIEPVERYDRPNAFYLEIPDKKDQTLFKLRWYRDGKYRFGALE